MEDSYDSHTNNNQEMIFEKRLLVAFPYYKPPLKKLAQKIFQKAPGLLIGKGILCWFLSKRFGDHRVKDV